MAFSCPKDGESQVCFGFSTFPSNSARKIDLSHEDAFYDEHFFEKQEEVDKQSLPLALWAHDQGPCWKLGTRKQNQAKKEIRLRLDDKEIIYFQVHERP